MSDIAFTREEKDALVAKLQRYFDDELSVELGQFDGEFLLNFFWTSLVKKWAHRFIIKA